MVHNRGRNARASLGGMIRKVHKCVSNQPYFVQLIPSETQRDLSYEVHSILPDDPPEEYVCSCPGFCYRGACKHQLKAWSDRCLWTEAEGPEVQTRVQSDTRRCPRCGQETYTETIDD